jgi:hypothetical protein
MPYVNFRNRKVAALAVIVVLLSCMVLWWLVSLFIVDMPAEGELGRHLSGIPGRLPFIFFVATAKLAANRACPCRAGRGPVHCKAESPHL